MKLIVNFSCSTVVDDIERITLNMASFCIDILGIDDDKKHDLYEDIANKDTTTTLKLCEDPQNTVLERNVWKNLFFFRWKRLQNLINAFHNVNNASNTNTKTTLLSNKIFIVKMVPRGTRRTNGY